MATIQNSLGSFSGKIGNVVFCRASKTKKAYIRSISTKTSVPTTRQLATRVKFTMTAAILSPFRNLIVDCWKKKCLGKSGYLQAFAQFLSSGFEGKYPDISIDMSKVQLSSGNLSGAGEYAYKRSGPELSITWSKYLDSDLPGSPFDEAIIAVYSEEVKLAAVYRNFARRADGQVSISMNDVFSAGKLHGWIIFLSEDRKQASASFYLGDGTSNS